jgi:hypothetical protein
MRRARGRGDRQRSAASQIAPNCMQGRARWSDDADGHCRLERSAAAQVRLAKVCKVCKCARRTWIIRDCSALLPGTKLCTTSAKKVSL